MDSMKRLVILGVGVTVMGVMAGVRPADAQTREARGTITSVSDGTLAIKAGTQELTFVVDSETHLEVRSAAKKVQQEQPGAPSPRVKDFFEVGQAILVRYREASGRNHALDISRVGSAGSGGGSVSEPLKIADGKVTSVTPSQLTIANGGRDVTFAISKDTDVLARGATKATKAAGGTTTITTFVHAGDTVSVSYSDAGGKAMASEVRVRVVNR
jgi:Domain of unknown function (DUF5666)